MITIPTLLLTLSAAAIPAAVSEHLPFLSIAGFTVLALIRGYWVRMHTERLVAGGTFYCWRKQLGSLTVAELGELWPAQWLYLEIWRWNFRRYVVHQDLYDQMNYWLAGELLKDNWDEEIIREAADKETKGTEEK